MDMDFMATKAASRFGTKLLVAAKVPMPMTQRIFRRIVAENPHIQPVTLRYSLPKYAVIIERIFQSGDVSNPTRLVQEFDLNAALAGDVAGAEPRNLAALQDRGRTEASSRYWSRSL